MSSTEFSPGNGVQTPENLKPPDILDHGSDGHHPKSIHPVSHSRPDTGLGHSSDIDHHSPHSAVTSWPSLILDTIGGTPEENSEDDKALATEIMRGGAPVPPDGGYGWVIIFSSFVANLVIDGITATFGIFLPPMVDSFHAGNGQVAWAGSLLAGGLLLLGPIVGSLTNKYGCRIVCISGGIIGAAGFIISSFANSLGLLLFSYGILGAIGLGLIYLPNIVSVGYYFEKRRAMATGIAMCGSGFGAIAFPPLASWLMGQTTWRNVNLVYAGLLFFAGCCGGLIKPLEVKKETFDDFSEDPNRRPLLDPSPTDEKHPLENVAEYFVVQLPDGGTERRHKHPMHSLDTLDHPDDHASWLVDHQFLTSQSPAHASTPIITTLSTITEQEHRSSSDSEGSKEPTRHNSVSRRSLDEAELDHHVERRFSIKAVPTPDSLDTVFPILFGRSPHPRRRDSMTSITSGPGRRLSFTETTSTEDEAAGMVVRRSRQPSRQGSIDSTYGDSVHHIIRPLSRKDIFYSGSIKHLPDEYQDPFNYRLNVLSLPPLDKVGKEEPPVAQVGTPLLHKDGGQKQVTTCCPAKVGKTAGAFLSALKNFMDFSLLRNPVFLCIALSGVIGMLGFHVPFVYIIDYSAEKKISRDDAAILISIIGIMNTIGRVGFGMISDSPRVNSLYLYNLCLFGMGLSVLIVPVAAHYWTLVIAYVTFGLFLSGFISLTSIALVDLLGLDCLTNSFGLLIFFRGLSSIVGSPFAGFLYDSFKSYDIPFFLAGTFLVIASLISSLIPLVVKCCPRTIGGSKNSTVVTNTTPLSGIESRNRGDVEDRDSGRFSEGDVEKGRKSSSGSSNIKESPNNSPEIPEGTPRARGVPSDSA